LPPPNAALLDAHAAVHRGFDDAVYDVLTKLVALDVAGARARFHAFKALLEEHMAFEEARVLPLYEQVAPKDGPGRLDHVRGDHTILVRHLDAIGAFLDGELPSLRAVLEQLPVVYRLLATLEHHTVREQNNVYPVVAVADDVVTALEALAHRIAAA
jgi:hypothetical protein